MRRGCIILVIISALVIMVVSVSFFVLNWPETKKRGTSQVIYVLEKALEEFHKDQSKYPEGGNPQITEALYGNNDREKIYLLPASALTRDGELCDLFKRPLRFRTEQDGSITIDSSGPDKIFDTDDDITSALIRELEQELPRK